MRKILGVVLIIIGGFLALLITFASIPAVINAVKMDLDFINKSAYLFGTFLGFILMGLLPFWLIKKGIKLTKKKMDANFNDKIESIK